MWDVQSRVNRVRGPSAKGHKTLGMGDPTLLCRYPYIVDIVSLTRVSPWTSSRSAIPWNGESLSCSKSQSDRCLCTWQSSGFCPISCITACSCICTNSVQQYT
jgi:hypothetical protein